MNSLNRLDSPSYHENITPILEVLSAYFPSCSGDVLEIGSGTGQHIIDFAKKFPHITWWPSDIREEHLLSIKAWEETASLPNLKDPIYLDAEHGDWLQASLPAEPHTLCGIISINVTHISSWATTQNIFLNAGKLLKMDGFLYLYGPYSKNGRHTSTSNELFDSTLRSSNPDWGVRDISDIERLAHENNLQLDMLVDMPVNNFSLIIRRI